MVGYDRTGDIAVIKLSGASGLQTVTTSTGSAAVGQAVVGVGNAGGTGGTPSAAGGSITALNQSITASDDGGGNAENLTGLIEVNADIQPGDSGGSLVNTSGQVIGMDTAASADSDYQVSATQAYAIPIDTALSVAHKIVAGQASSTIHIGATGFLGLGISRSSLQLDGSSASGFGGRIRAASARQREHRQQQRQQLLVAAPWCPRCSRAPPPARPAWWSVTPSTASNGSAGQLADRPHQPAGVQAPRRHGPAAVDRPVRSDPHRLGEAGLGSAGLTRPAPGRRRRGQDATRPTRGAPPSRARRAWRSGLPRAVTGRSSANSRYSGTL